jgi:predicted DNA-binding ribbon-helix-helix protein
LTFRPTERRHDNLSSAIRLFVLDYYHRAAMTAKQKGVPADFGNPSTPEFRSPSRGRQKRSVIRKLQLMDGEQQQTFSGLGF